MKVQLKNKYKCTQESQRENTWIAIWKQHCEEEKKYVAAMAHLTLEYDKTIHCLWDLLKEILIGQGICYLHPPEVFSLPLVFVSRGTKMSINPF